MLNKTHIIRYLLICICVLTLAAVAISLTGGAWASSEIKAVEHGQQTGDSYPISDEGTTPTPTPTPRNVSVTVGTNPDGLSFMVDSVLYNSTQNFNWALGSVHTLSTTSPQGAGPVRYLWNNWSDGGAQTHTVMPTVSSTFTANFTTRYLLTMCCNSELGTVSPPTGFFDAGQTVQISAIGNGRPLDRWVGTGTGSYSGPDNPATVVMNGPIREDAVFLVPPTPIPTPTPG